MSLYDDLQKDIGEALKTDLLDAYVDFTVTDFTGNTYDPVTGDPSSTETVFPFKGVALTLKSRAGLDTPDEDHDLVLLVMDTDRPIVFKEEQMITMVSNGAEYRLMKIDTDPVKASWTLSCFKWN